MNSVVRTTAVGVLFCFSFPALCQTYFNSSAPAVAIPDTGTVCQSIAVSGGPASIIDVNVRATLNHPVVGTLTIQLNGPQSGGNPKLTLLNRAGTHYGSGISSTAQLWGSLVGGIQFSESYIYGQPEGRVTAETMGINCGGSPPFIIGASQFCANSVYVPYPDGADTPPGVGVDLWDFKGLDSNGTWQLCVTDQTADSSPSMNPPGATFTTWSIGFNGDYIFKNGFE